MVLNPYNEKNKPYNQHHPVMNHKLLNYMPKRILLLNKIHNVLFETSSMLTWTRYIEGTQQTHSSNHTLLFFESKRETFSLFQSWENRRLYQ